MPRELKFQALLPGCTAQQYYQIACSDSRAIKQFHLEVKKDETTTVSEWDASTSSRVITFTLDMAIPASLQRIVGAGPIFIKETQTVTWLDSTTLKIVTIPRVKISMGDKLSTRAELIVSTTSDGCQIDATVTVSAAVPWLLQSTVESLMTEQVKKTMEEYVAFICKYVDNALQEMNNQALQQQQQTVLQTEEVSRSIEVTTEAPAAEAAITQQYQQQQQQLVVASKPEEAPAAAAAALWVDARATAGMPQPSAPAAAAEADVFYDAQEGVVELLLRDLRQAQEERREANRLLLSIKGSMQQIEQTLSKEVAFQEGVRYGQRMGGGTLLLSVAAAAAAASAATAYLLMRQSRK